MLLTITTTHTPATDLGYLLHKHPDRIQTFDLAFGRAVVFYPEVGAERTTACLLLNVDPIGMVRGKAGGRDGLLDQYVNDRPYVASSFLSVAIAQVFGSAMNGRSKDRPDLASTPIPLEARLDVLPVRGSGETMLHDIFELSVTPSTLAGCRLTRRFLNGEKALTSRSPSGRPQRSRNCSRTSTCSFPSSTTPSTTGWATAKWRSCSTRAKAGSRSTLARS